MDVFKSTPVVAAVVSGLLDGRAPKSTGITQHPLQSSSSSGLLDPSARAQTRGVLTSLGVFGAPSHDGQSAGEACWAWLEDVDVVTLEPALSSSDNLLQASLSPLDLVVLEGQKLEAVLREALLKRPVDAFDITAQFIALQSRLASTTSDAAGAEDRGVSEGEARVTAALRQRVLWSVQSLIRGPSSSARLLQSELQQAAAVKLLLGCGAVRLAAQALAQWGRRRALEALEDRLLECARLLRAPPDQRLRLGGWRKRTFGGCSDPLSYRPPPLPLLVLAPTSAVVGAACEEGAAGGDQGLATRREGEAEWVRALLDGQGQGQG